MSNGDTCLFMDAVAPSVGIPAVQRTIIVQLLPYALEERGHQKLLAHLVSSDGDDRIMDTKINISQVS